MKTNKEWIGTSDLMAGLMMIFLFIAIAFMYDNENKVKALDKKAINQTDVEQLQSQIKQLQSQIKLNQSTVEREPILQSRLRQIESENQILKQQIQQLQSQIELNQSIVEREPLLQSLIRKTQAENEKLKNRIFEIQEDEVRKLQIESDINSALLEEFRDDLKRWNAEILQDNTIIFKSPNILFKSDSSEISQKFKVILNNFFPRYIAVLQSDRFINSIKNIKIAGHTSSIWNWNRQTIGQEMYFNHMELSQDRALSVLKYCYLNNQKHKDWLSSILETSGLSYSQTVKSQGKENIKQSHRVEFKVIVTSIN